MRKRRGEFFEERALQRKEGRRVERPMNGKRREEEGTLLSPLAPLPRFDERSQGVCVMAVSKKGLKYVELRKNT